MATEHTKWIAQSLRDLWHSRYIDGADDTSPMKLYLDNKGSLDLVEQPQVNDRSEHIDIAYHFVRDIQTKGIIQCVYFPQA